ncbi:CgeB family protein [Anaeromyxobacter oryzisoli]|uniref:CgeB family protein n=1 Tax=Anaeromyxobacter oryzisoli TaxID=2925408 RepID=UPI001F579F6A|nr:glycosyltransferase [Anaeromyxobacter sp. SG63]
MKIALFVHSLRSDWNHGNAHFLRGVASELVHRGHAVTAFEPRDAWSAQNLAREQGAAALDAWREAYPEIPVRTYDLAALDLGEALDGVALALVHEWSDPALVARLGQERARRPGLRLLFHDTHHRAITRPEELARNDLSRYDGVLAFGRVLAEVYRARGWGPRAWVWHEAADVRRFRPAPPEAEREGDLVFVGNWGDDERTAELREFLLEPVRALGLSASVYGVRYPDAGRRALAAAGVAYRGWLANHRAPGVLARHRVTVHVPRRPYAEALPGIPTIRPFEALACGVPLVCAPWDDVEGLFRPGRDYLVARDGAEMRRHLRAILSEPGLARALAASGLEIVRARHTCAHRVDELLAVAAELGAGG